MPASANNLQEGGVQPTPPLATLEDAGAPTTPTERATRFIDAIRQKQMPSLLSMAVLPFQLRDTGTSVSCKSGSAEDADQLAKLLSCLVTDDLLGEELQAIPKPETQLVRAAEIPSWGRRWRKHVGAGRSAVLVYIPGNGVSYFFVVVVESTGVREIWKHAEFDAG